MVESLHADVEVQLIDAFNTENEWLIWFRQYDLRMTNKKTRTFDGEIWTHFPCGVNGARQKRIGGETNQVGVGIINLDGGMAPYLNDIDFVGSVVTIWEIFPASLSVADETASSRYREFFTGEIDDVVRDEILAFNLVSFHDLRPPKHRICGPFCNYHHGDESCGVALETITATVSAAGTAGGKAYIEFSGMDSQSDGYWNNAVLQCSAVADSARNANIRLSRKGDVYTDSNRRFILNYPFFVEPGVGDTFAVTRQCKYDFEDCEDRFSNGINFGGYPRATQEVYPLVPRFEQVGDE